MGTKGFRVKRFFEDMLDKIKLFFEDVCEIFRKIRDHNITFKIGRTITKTIKKLWHGLVDYVYSWDYRHSSGESFKIHE